jgi:glycosyltransferase involved in cell wall biosynthesis
MKIAIDLRLLNYPHITGVSIYTLHLLERLWVLKNQKSESKLQIYAIGLKPERLALLQSEFLFLRELFEKNIDLNTYLGIKYIKNSKLLSLFLLLKSRIIRNINDTQICRYNYLILPQPRILPKHPKTKLITIFHDLYSILDRSNLTLTQKMLDNKHNYSVLAKNSTELWAVSLATCLDLQKILCLQPEKIKLVYSGLPDLSRLGKKDIQPAPSTTIPKTDYILAISGIEPRKNWYNLLLAHKYLQDTYKDYNSNLVLAGKVVDKKYFAQLQKLIYNQNIQGVEWFFDVNEVEKSELLANCKFVVYPSLYEGFGFPILEAYKYSKPVITTKVSSMPEVAKDSALYINPLNFFDIARAIYILLNDKQLYTLLQSKTDVNLKYFSWDELGNKLHETFGLD